MKMKRISMPTGIATSMLAVALLAGAGGLRAQDATPANPIATNLKASWVNVRDLITKMGDKMPDEGYRFKPMPDIPSPRPWSARACRPSPASKRAY
jgi:hypothetical protein